MSRATSKLNFGSTDLELACAAKYSRLSPPADMEGLVKR